MKEVANGLILEPVTQHTDKAKLIQDPYEQSIFLLVHVSYLQAFADVNKRTARLTANISLIKGNLVPLAYGGGENRTLVLSKLRRDRYMLSAVVWLSP